MHRGHRPAAAVTQAPPARPWRAALSLFTVIPVADTPEISSETLSRAVLWLPAVGVLLAGPAAGVLLTIEAGGHSAIRRLLAATLAVAVLGVLTGGLHLDGLADTVDGFGSRRPRHEALAIMRRPDIGPLGVAALVLVILLQITALAALPVGAPGAMDLALAVVTGRVAAVLATGPAFPAARPEGLGALVAGRTTARARAVTGAGLMAAATAAGAAVGGASWAVRGLAAAATGLLAAMLLRRTARRRLGGMTGDVYGAVIEVSTTVVLLVLALAT